jgi:signal transduction histidine kinase/ligand-binding sensor domain-containing protein/ActR/RegA family two-component response regulator
MLQPRNMRARFSTWNAAPPRRAMATATALAVSAVCALCAMGAGSAAADAADANAAEGGGAAARAVPAGQIAFRTYGADDGLTNLVVTGMAQDGGGARWVATDGGLFRLDGEHFVRMGMEEGISSSHVHAIEVGPEGGLCVGTPAELACERNGVFERLQGISVSQLARSPGALWIMTPHGLHVWRGHGAPAPVTVLPGKALPLLWGDERGVIVGEGTSLWLSADGVEWKALSLSLGGEGLGGGRRSGASGDGGDGAGAAFGDGAAQRAGDGMEVRELLRDGSGALWLRSTRRVWRAAAGEATAREVTYGLPASVDLRFGQSMARTNGGELILGTSGGLAFFRGDRWEVLDDGRGLPANSAHVVFPDRSGELWVGSVGVYRRLGRGLIERHTAASGLPGESVWAITRTADGSLLVGTNECLVEVVDGRWACVAGTQGKVVRTIARLPDGGVVFGGEPAELYHRAARERGGAVSKIADLTGDGARQVLSAVVDGSGALWVGASNGLYWRAAGGGQVVAVEESGGQTKRFVSAIVEDGPRLWFAGYEGLRVREGGAWTHLTERNGLRATPVRYLARRNDGRLCVIYDEALGVTCFRYGGGELSELGHVGDKEGLEPLVAYSLGEDSAGRLWLGTGLGLRVLGHEATGSIDRFTVRDGIAGNDASAMAFLLDGDGSLWFGSSSGLTHVAAGYRGVGEPPSVRLLSLRIGGRVLLGRSGGDEEQGERHTLTGGFVASSADGADVEYQARLSPIQESWLPAPARRVRYAGLSPGSYQLEVQARRKGAEWGPATRVAFELPPAWWQARWLWGVAGVLAVGVVALLALGWQRAALRRRTRALLAQTDAGFRAFLASMPEIVIVRRGDGAVLLNEAARELFATDGEDERMWLMRSVHPSDRRRVAALLRGEAAAMPARELMEVRVRAPGMEQWRDLEVSHQAVSLGGAPARILVGRDVTERRRLQTQMLMADRMVSLGTLVAGIGHEINNPLSYVLGNLEVIVEAVGREETELFALRREVKAAARDALDGASRVRTIVQRLGSFSRSSEEVRIAVKLDEVIAQAVRLTHNELRHRAKVVLALKAVPAVLADPGQLTQVIINLLINAAHAIAPGAADRHLITLRSYATEDHVMLEVQDTGTGMDSQVVARAFDPFFTTKRVGEGTGLGLSICHGIITSHGGQISIDSARGRGTTMRISLPAYREASGAGALTSVPAAAALEGAASAVVADEVDDSPMRPVSASSMSSAAAESAPRSSLSARGSGASALADAAASLTGIPAYIESSDPSLAVPPVDPSAPPRPRVLVIDDEPAVGKVLARMLRAEHEVVVLTDGEDALRRVSSGERFGAIITDVMMPVLTGLELREQLFAIDPDQARRVVFITGGVFNADTAELLEQPDVRCMTKPVDAEQLRRTVREVVAKRWDERAAG